MNRRGLTMVELLVALTLLSAIVGASAAWIAVAARISLVSGPFKRETVIQSALTRIQEDVLTGDFDIDDRRTQGQPRVRVQDNALEIDLRRGITHIYRLERSADLVSDLVRVQRENGESTTRPLLSDVVEFQCMIDENGEALEITLELRDDEPGGQPLAPRTVPRRYRLP